ncbi:MAG: hypothetical protein V2I54_10170 [Bacteroidales bacterium]|jgi:tetratricopeptide (TPR) repeat protein|nr:hypothetical protein [Bacteroidales bacterium]
MIKKVLIILSLSLASFSLDAQNWNEVYYLETEAEYFLKEKNFEKAIEMYEKILEEIPNSSFIKFQIGHAYLNTDEQKDKAIPYFEEALKDASADFDPRDIRETRSPLETYLYLGIAYQRDNRLDDAMNMYVKYKESISEDHYNYPLVNQSIKSCKNAQEMMDDPIRFRTQNLGNKINDNNPNFNPVFSGDGNTMVFTSYTRNYIDIFISEKNGDRWSSPKNITNQVSKKYYLKTSSLSYQGDELYLASDDPGDNDVFVSYKDGGQWVNARKLDKTISHRKSNETHASLTPDGKTLYFTSNREGGYGGLDIYSSVRDEKGKWSDPVNLGPGINTSFNEETPFVSHDGKYLFFSSEGHNTIGGYDIFYVDLTNPEKVVNIGYPVNTTADDLFFVPGESKSDGYMARVFEDSQGKKDIYHLSILPDIHIQGTIMHLADNKVIDDQVFNVQILDHEKDAVVRSEDVNQGEFSFKAEPGSYQVVVSNENFKPFKKDITIPDDYDQEVYTFSAQLQPESVEPEMLAEQVKDSVEGESQALAQTKVDEQEEIKGEAKDSVIKQDEQVYLASTEPLSIEESRPDKIVIIQPQTNNNRAGKSFAVQLMALHKPVALNYFKDVMDISVTKYPDGFYRYTVGITNSYEMARKLQAKMNEQGYPDTFIREYPFSANYTIQLMALIVPVDLSYFKNLSTVSVTRGADDFYRYTIGYYGSYNEAEVTLENLRKQGYVDAFIKKVNQE